MSLIRSSAKAQVLKRDESAKSSRNAVKRSGQHSSLGKRDSERNAPPRGSAQVATGPQGREANRGAAPSPGAERSKKRRQKVAKERDERFAKKPLDPKLTLAGVASKRARARLFESSLTLRGPWSSEQRDKMHHIAQSMSKCSCPVGEKDFIVSRRGKAGMPRKWSRPLVRKCDQVAACWTCAARQAASQAADVESMIRLHLATNEHHTVMMSVVTVRHLPGGSFQERCLT